MARITGNEGEFHGFKYRIEQRDLCLLCGRKKAFHLVPLQPEGDPVPVARGKCIDLKAKTLKQAHDEAQVYVIAYVAVNEMDISEKDVRRIIWAALHGDLPGIEMNGMFPSERGSREG